MDRLTLARQQTPDGPLSLREGQGEGHAPHRKPQEACATAAGDTMMPLLPRERPELR